MSYVNTLEEYVHYQYYFLAVLNNWFLFFLYIYNRIYLIGRPVRLRFADSTYLLRTSVSGEYSTLVSKKVGFGKRFFLYPNPSSNNLPFDSSENAFRAIQSNKFLCFLKINSTNAIKFRGLNKNGNNYHYCYLSYFSNLFIFNLKYASQY